MSFVVYHKQTTVILPAKNRYWYETAGAAAAGLTRAVNSGKAKREDYEICDIATFHDRIEKKETKVNLMTGKEFKQSVNTPHCCDPSTETYWSM
jgi:hypothetical protein